RFKDRPVLADAGHRILKDAPAGLVIEHIVGREYWHMVPRREVDEAIEPLAVIAGEAARCTDPDAPLRFGRERAERRFRSIPVALVRHKDEELAGGEVFVLRRNEVGQEELGVALFRLVPEVANA